MEEQLFPPRIDGHGDPFGAVSAVALAGDLRVLRRGPGAQPGQDMSRIGPALRTMCGIASSDRAADAVAAVAAWLRARVSTLDSATQRRCATLVFGLDETAQYAQTGARVAAGAGRLGVNEKTVRRHTDAAITAIAAATPPGQSLPRQLRGHTGSWIDLGIAQDEGTDPKHDASDNTSRDTRRDTGRGTGAVVRRVGGENVLSTHCFLIAVARCTDPPDKILAVVRFGTNPRVATAVPAVRIRHVRSAASAGSDVLTAEGREHGRDQYLGPRQDRQP